MRATFGAVPEPAAPLGDGAVSEALESELFESELLESEVLESEVLDAGAEFDAEAVVAAVSSCGCPATLATRMRVPAVSNLALRLSAFSRPSDMWNFSASSSGGPV